MSHDRSLVVAAGDLFENDYDADADTLTAVLVTDAAHGTLSLASDGGFTYTPDAGFTGDDTFTYTADDAADDVAATQTATVTIHVTNETPWANDQQFFALHDAALNIATPELLDYAGDYDDDALTAAAVTDPLHGALTLNADGTFSYTPDAGFTGTDSFTYQVSDSLAASTPVTVTLTVYDNAPIAAGDAYDVTHDQTLAIAAAGGLLANDFDSDSDALTASVTVAPAHGSLTLNADGSFSYTPAAGYLGPDTFTYASRRRRAVHAHDREPQRGEQRAGGRGRHVWRGRRRRPDPRRRGGRAGQRHGRRRRLLIGEPADRRGPRHALAVVRRQFHVHAR